VRSGGNRTTIDAGPERRDAEDHQMRPETPQDDTPATPTITGRAPDGGDLEGIVERIRTVILRAMAGDEAAVAEHFAPDAELVFVGRRLARASDIGRFNATRYRFVKKAIDQWDVAASGDRMVVTSVGTLYGEWLDGTPFAGNRYIDRFVLVDGRITRMDVWNDSAERLLDRIGSAAI
jgi:hypothetical protein